MKSADDYFEELTGLRTVRTDPFRIKHLIGYDVEHLTFAQLQYIREVYRHGVEFENECRIVDDELQIVLRDDYHPPGWYVYQPWEGETREILLEFARQKKAERFLAFLEKSK